MAAKKARYFFFMVAESADKIIKHFHIKYTLIYNALCCIFTMLRVIRYHFNIFQMCANMYCLAP